MARIVNQDPKISETFRQRIKAKVDGEKQQMGQKIDEDLSKLVSWAIKPLANIAFDNNRRKLNEKGEQGEATVSLRLHKDLSNQWTLLNDIVLELEPEVFAQIDHILVGPSGIFVIETKAWQGAFTAYKDSWRRKEGNKWINCDSPTKQNIRHVVMFRKWLDQTRIVKVDLAADKWIFPVVVFTQAQWLGIKECSMLVTDGVSPVIKHIKSVEKDIILSPVHIEKIVRLLASPTLANAFRFDQIKVEMTFDEYSNSFVAESKEDYIPGLPQHEVSETKAGKKFVKIKGSHHQAEMVWNYFKAEGENPGNIQKDKFREETYFFYLEK